MVLDELAVGKGDTARKKPCRHVARVDDGARRIPEQPVQAAGRGNDLAAGNAGGFFCAAIV